MPGLFETGGAIDSLFDVLRSELGKADTSVQAWFHDKLRQDTNRYAVQRILWAYGQGIKENAFPAFRGMNDANAQKIVAYVKSKAAFDEAFIYNVLFALFDKASEGDVACAAILAGAGGNVFDDFMNGGAVNAVTGVINDTLSGLGLPSLANTVIVLGVIGVIGAIVYLKVRK